MEEDYTTSQGGRLNHPDDIKKYFSHRTFLDFVLDKTNPLVYVRLLMDGKYFLEKSSFQAQLHQKTNQHDEFTIIIPDDSLDSFEGIIMENSKKIIGKTITAEFWRFGTVKQSFMGVITKLKNTKKHGYGYLYIMGNSPTIMMEHGLECQSFEDKSLAEIIKNITKEYSSELNIDTDNLNQYNKQNAIPYTVQYKETDYQFLQRLAKRYGEFFYYNGQRLIFGNKTEKKILLEEGKELKEFEMELTTRPQNFQYSTYDGVSGQELQNDTQNVPDLFGKTNPFQTTAYNASKQLYKKIPKAFHSQTSLDKTSSDLHNAILKEKESRQNLVEVRGKSIDPELRQGCLIEMRDFNDRPLETYRITEIKHFYDGNNYENEFTAFNDAIVPLYYDENAFPICEEQYARVIDNNDPIASGRVRVQFAWQKGKNKITPWVRLILPHSGANKGFSFIPEIGEEVLVGFESMNAETPFILGTQYNGAETSGYHTSGNDIKAIHTRSGTKIILNDAEGSIFIEDPSGNTYLMDGQGNIKVNAPKNISFDVGNNFDINVANNMTFNVGNIALLNILQHTIIKTPQMLQMVSGFYHTQAGKALINSESEMKIEAKEANIMGYDKLFVHSDESAIINSKGTVEMKGENGTSQSNIAETVAVTEPILDAKALVVFRPHSSWINDPCFTLDWLRTGAGSGIGETTFDGDIDYSTITGYYRDNAESGAFIMGGDANRNGIKDLYDKVIAEYIRATATDKSGNSIKYYIPKLTIYKNEREADTAIANLEVQFEVYEEPDELILEYDNAFFNISSYGAVIAGRSSSPARAPLYTPPRGYKKYKLFPKSVTGAVEKDEIVIECIAPFGGTAGKQIKAYTIKANPDPALPPIKKLAGILEVIPNNVANRKIKKVVLVNVKTDITASGTEDDGYDIALVLQEKKNIRKFLRHSLVDVVFKETVLKLSSKNETNTTTRDHFNRTYVDGTEIRGYYDSGVTKPSGWVDLDDYLFTKLKAKYGAVYDNCIRVFYLPQNKVFAGLARSAKRQVGGYSALNNIVMPKQGSLVASSHEICHSMGLPHAWKSKNHIKAGTTDNRALNGKHSFKYQSTFNLMDYSSKQYFLWRWQCRTVNGSGQPEPANYTPQIL